MKQITYNGMLINALREAADKLEFGANASNYSEAAEMVDKETITMADAIAAGQSVLIAEQAALLRECRSALHSLLTQKPMLGAFQYGTSTLGNLQASLHEYRPGSIFGGTAQE